MDPKKDDTETGAGGPGDKIAGLEADVESPSEDQAEGGEESPEEAVQQAYDSCGGDPAKFIADLKNAGFELKKISKPSPFKNGSDETSFGFAAARKSAAKKAFGGGK